MLHGWNTNQDEASAKPTAAVAEEAPKEAGEGPPGVSCLWFQGTMGYPMTEENKKASMRS